MKKTYVQERKEFDKEVFGTGSKWDFCYITPEEYVKYYGDKQHSLKELIGKAKRADKGTLCECGMDNVWEHAGTDMCFACTTGETDRSEDLELTMDKNKQPHYKEESI